ncbi:unnamed protein product [Ilex paraguariensis]|uniref:Lipoyl-binding domain-containing protein n=1 Tax=Ilex paraguariensis TaxID=185542 RepID=A0ABC8U981_9AQUA
MAACSFGASSIKTPILKLGGSIRPKLGTLQLLHGTRIVTPTRYDRLVISQRSEKALIECQCSSVEAGATTKLEEGSRESISSGAVSHPIPSSYEVEYLLTKLCDTTSVAEFELNLDGFRLYVLRDLTGRSKTSPPPTSAPVSTSATVDTPDLNGSVSSLSLSKPLPFKAADEGLVVLQSPRVGYFRRSRTIKGKRAPPSCKEKQIVKEGQVLCYIEQLGGEIPIESDTSGEVIKILREDGDPVGYGDALIGIKKLQ